MAKKVYNTKHPLNIIIYSNRRFKMDFSTIVIVVLVAAVAYTFYKAFSKKETVVDAVKEEVAEVKAVEAIAKTTVKKATSKPAPKATAKNPATKKVTKKSASK